MRHPVFLMVFVNVCWGLSFLLSKHGMNVGFTPMSLALFRYIFAFLSLVLAVRLEKGKGKGMGRVEKRDILPMILSGLMGITLYYFFEYNGIQRTSTVDASLILAAIPIMTMGADALLFRRRLGRVEVLGSLISLAGVGLVVLSGTDSGTASLAGNLFVVAAGMVWVAYIFLCRDLRSRYDSLRMNMWQSLVGMATMIPLALMEGGSLRAIPWDGWLAAIGLGAVCSALCYVLYGHAIRVLTPLQGSIFINIIPLIAMGAGVAFLGETASWPSILGGGLILLSILMINRQSRTAPAS